jgi:uncharacterized protein YaiI (UPF0178 family)
VKLDSEENIGGVRAVRIFMHERREGGTPDGPRGFGSRDAQQLAAALDRGLDRR